MKQETKQRIVIQWTGLIGGPLLAIVCYWLLPVEYQSADGGMAPFASAGRVTLAVMVWMGTWWLTEAVDVSVTALLPLGLFPLIGAGNMEQAAAPYANPFIFLFMGGFILALSMQRWGLGKRIALLTLRLVGTRPSNMIAGFMLVTAVLSSFVSNTATTAMMLPIAVSVVELLRRKQAGETDRDADTKNGHVASFATCLMLCIAYASSVGGMTTIIGTPPNVFLISFLKDDIPEPYQMEISFVRWLLIGVPLAVILLPSVFLLMTRVLHPIRIRKIEGGKELIHAELLALGSPQRGEWVTFVMFLLTVFLWIFRTLLAKIQFDFGDVTLKPFAGLTDPGIVMLTALLLFVIPVDLKRCEFTMDWATARKLPWGILILFGGGLSLAEAVDRNHVAEFLGSQASYFGNLPPIVLVLVVVTGIVFLTELTSNFATTASLVPVLAALAPGFGVSPYLLVIPAAIAASCAFMLPVATPPNALVFGSGEVTLPQMARAGLLLNLISIVVITALTFLVIKPLLGF